MKHLKKGRKLGRKIKQRKALLKGLVRQLFEKEEILTTEAKAKELKTLAERIINQTKRMLSSRKEESIPVLREIKAKISPRIEGEKLEELATRFAKRKGGYLRIVKVAARKSDGAKMAIVRILKD